MFETNWNLDLCFWQFPGESTRSVFILQNWFQSFSAVCSKLLVRTKETMTKLFKDIARIRQRHFVVASCCRRPGSNFLWRKSMKSRPPPGSGNDKKVVAGSWWCPRKLGGSDWSGSARFFAGCENNDALLPACAWAAEPSWTQQHVPQAPWSKSIFFLYFLSSLGRSKSSIDIHHLQTSNNVERQAKNCDIYPLVLR